MADSDDSKNVLFPHGGYLYLRSYNVAEAVYDATVVFCARFVGKQTRTHDQMVQAARSGVRNISEGSGMAATSRTLEINLTNVARASLNDELRKDYESFLLQRGLRIWPKDAPEALAVREQLKQDTASNVQPFVQGQPCLAGLKGLTDFIRGADAEWAANTMLCAIHQAAYLLRRQVQQQARTLAQEGGFRERVKALQLQRTEPNNPPCPECGHPTQQRTAQTGKYAGKPFYGCTRYPKCRGIVNKPQ